MARLQRENIPAVGAVRGGPAGERTVVSPNLGLESDWSALLAGKQAVIHTAARAHVLEETEGDPLALFRAQNVAGTLALARQALAAGVRRFIFLSSVGVNGIQSTRPFTEDHTPAPVEPYALSKLEAERGLMALAAGTDMEVVILRPPLVYGRNAPGNFGRLVNAIARGRLLPLGAICHNQRSLVALDNLLDLIVSCLTHPAAANQIFLAADGEDISTAGLVQRLAAAMGVPAHLLPVPVWTLKAAAAALGKDSIVQKLAGNLQVDIGKARRVLGWHPPIGVDEGLRRAVAGMLRESPRAR